MSTVVYRAVCASVGGFAERVRGGDRGVRRRVEGGTGNPEVKSGGVDELSPAVGIEGKGMGGCLVACAAGPPGGETAARRGGLGAPLDTGRGVRREERGARHSRG